MNLFKNQVISILLFSLLSLTLVSCNSTNLQAKVVIYTSVDQVFSEPILKVISYPELPRLELPRLELPRPEFPHLELPRLLRRGLKGIMKKTGFSP